LGWRGGGRRRKRSLAQELRVFHRGRLTDDEPTIWSGFTVTCEASRHVASDRQAAISGELI
jgi:hypothetical protein